MSNAFEQEKVILAVEMDYAHYVQQGFSENEQYAQRYKYLIVSSSPIGLLMRSNERRPLFMLTDPRWSVCCIANLALLLECECLRTVKQGTFPAQFTDPAWLDKK